jgi:hypothetical protein
MIGSFMDGGTVTSAEIYIVRGRIVCTELRRATVEAVYCVTTDVYRCAVPVPSGLTSIPRV